MTTDTTNDAVPVVVGIALNPRGRLLLTRAFPNCQLYGDSLEDMASLRERCNMARRTTIFVDLPASGTLAHRRTGLLFDQAKVKIIALCEECTDAIYETALLLEFSGVMAVESNVAAYRRAAAAVQRGELWVSRECLSNLALRAIRNPARLDFSEREMTILELMLAGYSNQQIADRLFLSRETIRWHLKSLYAKLGVSDREAARQYARNLLVRS